LDLFHWERLPAKTSIKFLCSVAVSLNHFPLTNFDFAVTRATTSLSADSTSQTTKKKRKRKKKTRMIKWKKRKMEKAKMMKKKKMKAKEIRR
jgi:hypothetical protein